MDNYGLTFTISFKRQGGTICIINLLVAIFEVTEMLSKEFNNHMLSIDHVYFIIIGSVECEGRPGGANKILFLDLTVNQKWLYAIPDFKYLYGPILFEKG